MLEVIMSFWVAVFFFLSATSFSFLFLFDFLFNWMPRFLPLVATLLAVHLLCQSRVISRGAGPLRVVLTYSKRCSFRGLLWLIVLTLCVVPGACTRGWVNRAQTDKHSRWKTGDAERVRGTFDRAKYWCLKGNRAGAELRQRGGVLEREQWLNVRTFETHLKG